MTAAAVARGRGTMPVVEWAYYVAAAEDGAVLSIARRAGPEIQVLAHAGEWVDRPQILERFRDPGYFEQVTEAAARRAGSSLGIAWPS